MRSVCLSLWTTETSDGPPFTGKEVQLTSRRCSFYRTPEEAAIDKEAQAAYLLVGESNAYSK